MRMPLTEMEEGHAAVLKQEMINFGIKVQQDSQLGRGEQNG